MGRMRRGVRVPTPAVPLLGTGVTVAITWPAEFLDENYIVSALPEGASLLGLQVSLVLGSRTKTGCQLLLKTTLAAIALNAGFLHVTAFRP